MGTRADFYIGRGAEAEWIGSIAWDGYPDGIPLGLRKCKTQQGFKRSVTHFLKDREDKSLPADGWPWPWDDSGTTDFAYAFDKGRVYASCFGGKWFIASKNRPVCDDDEFKVAFPNMKDKKRRPIFGKHSGIVLVS